MHKKDLVFKNRDEKRILATLRQPGAGGVGADGVKGVDAGVKGTVILLHGLGGWKEQPLIVIMAEAMCEKGYNVFTFDAADGAKGPDGDFEHSTTTGFVNDLDDVVGYVTNADWYSGPLILVGHSMGGLTALHYTRLHPAQVSKLALVAPAVSWKRGLGLTLIGGSIWLARNKRKTPGPNHSKLPLDRAWLLDFMKFDALRDAPYVSAPALVISASRDTAVTSAKAHGALTSRFANATNVVIPGAGHVFWKHEKKVADTITQWLTSS